MPWQSSLTFDETYAWFNFITNVVNKARPGVSFTWYGFKNKKTILLKLTKQRIQLTNITMLSSKGEVKYENNLRFFEVELMSKALIDKHLHTYERSITKSDSKANQVYRCTDPDCNHYTTVKFIVGKRARCFKCNESYITYKEQFNKLNRHLVCLACSKSKRGRLLNEVTNATATILDDLEDILNGEIKSNG